TCLLSFIYPHATTIHPLSLHDAFPICKKRDWDYVTFGKEVAAEAYYGGRREPPILAMDFTRLKDEKAVLARAREYAKTSTKDLRSEEHTSELQSLTNIVCRPLPAKKHN